MVKSKDWERARRILKQEFARAGIQRCEQCGTDNFLSFAHSKKRRFIQSDEDLFDVALLCIPCHEKIEYRGHEYMYNEVRRICDSRITQINIRGKL